MNRILVCLCALMLSFASVAAQEVLRGRVVDKDGVPIPGARVSVKGGTESALSDFDGTYRLIVEGAVEKVVVDYVGFNTRIVKVEDAENLVLTKTTLWNEVRKNNWMISAQMAFPEIEQKQPSYGLMVGWCRNFGGYVKGVWRQGKETVYSTTQNPSDMWLTGEYDSAYRAIMAGAVVRLKSPFHLYAGAGVTQRKVAYEVSGVGYLDYCSEDSPWGWIPGIDAGVIFKIRYFMLNAGVMWSPGRAGVVGDFGIGVSF